MKKIVCVLRTLGSGGAQKALTFVANSLAEDKNMQVTLIALYKSKFSLTVSPNVQVITGDLKIDAYRDMSGWQRKTAQLKNLFWLRKQLKTVKPDLMCVFLADLVFFCTMAKLFMRIPLIASERGTPQKFSRFQRFRYSLGYRWASKVVFQTKTQQDFFCEAIRRNSCVIENPLIARLDAGADSAARDASADKSFVVAGALSPIKGFDLAIDAMQKVCAKYPDARLEIFGKGPQQAALEAQIRENGLTENVFLRGEVANVFAQCNSAYFMLTSREEGMPNVLLEAILQGLPSIAADCESGGPRTILDNGRRGILIPREDVDALAEAMLRILDDPEKARQIAAQAAAECAVQFDKNVIARKWADVVHEVLDQK